MSQNQFGNINTAITVISALHVSIQIPLHTDAVVIFYSNMANTNGNLEEHWRNTLPHLELETDSTTGEQVVFPFQSGLHV